MSSTYQKIHSIVSYLSTVKNAHSVDELIENLKKIEKGSGSVIFKKPATASYEFISKQAFRRTLNFAARVGVLEFDHEKKFSVSSQTRSRSSNEITFKKFLSVKILDYLEECNIPFAEIKTAAEAIQTPTPRNPSTILASFEKRGGKPGVDSDEFSRTLFLLACTEHGTTRSVKVNYIFS